MAIYELDSNGKRIPNKGRSRREQASRMERGTKVLHFEIRASIPQGGKKYKQILRRYWLRNKEAARAKENDLKRIAPADALTWRAAFNIWKADNNFAESHIKNAETTITMWEEAFGASSTIEKTTLAEFSKWFADLAKNGTGRSAQNRRANMLAIARWCRSRGYIAEIPFNHSPKPLDRMEERKPSELEHYYGWEEVLPASLKPIWHLLGITGMRVSAACGIKESDLNDKGLTVTTKFSEEVFYNMTPEIRAVIDEAKAFKAAGRKKGRGKRKVILPIDTPYLFCNDRGNPWTKDTISNKLRKLRIKYPRLPKVTPHQLRHMAGTILGEENYSTDMIGAALAQKDRRSSEDYVDKTLRMRTAALAKVAKVLADSDPRKIQERGSKSQESGTSGSQGAGLVPSQNKHVICPQCGCNFSISKD